MKNILLKMLQVLAGILLSVIIINSQNTQKTSNAEPMTKEQHKKVYQQYLDFYEGRE